MSEVCDWIETHDGWETDCGHMVVIIDRTPEEDKITHCTYCGRAICQYLGTDPDDPEECYENKSEVKPNAD
jgi:hypothetical protein